MIYLILFGAMIALFYKAMYCGYVVDDVQQEYTFKSKHGLKQLLREKKVSIWKYLLESCYGAGFFNNAQQEYVFTLVVHYINCCLIFHMSQSWMAAVLYLVNPVNNQTALWMNGRRYALTILAVLLTWNWHFLGVVLFPFCALIHISGIVAPLLLVNTPYWPLIPVFAVSGYFIFRKRLYKVFLTRRAEFKAGNENHNLNWRKGILYIKSVGYNFQNCIFPIKPAMYHDFLFHFSNSVEDNEAGYSFNWEFFKGLALTGGLIYMIAVQHNFWAFWFLLFISPWCNIYQVTMNASDRYCSLANVGAMLMLAGIIQSLPAPYNTSVFIGFTIFYVLKYQPLFRAYTTIENFYLYHLNQAPDLVIPRFYLCRYYLERKDIYSAFATIQQGRRYRPNNFMFLFSLMEILFQLGKVDSALKVMAVAEKYIPMCEVDDVKKFFADRREQFKKEINTIEDIRKKRSKNVHNNGRPLAGVSK